MITSPGSRSPKRKGFTLLELTVVLALVVVIAGVVIVRVDGWSSRQALRGSARTLGNVIQLYRGKAELEERTYLLTLEMGSGRYRVDEKGQGAGGAATPEALRTGSLGSGRSFERVMMGETLLPSPVVLVLGPRGVLGNIRIAIANRDKEQVTLALGVLENDIDYVESP